jgi:hypothetical protein
MLLQSDEERKNFEEQQRREAAGEERSRDPRIEVTRILLII